MYSSRKICPSSQAVTFRTHSNGVVPTFFSLIFGRHAPLRFLQLITTKPAAWFWGRRIPSVGEVLVVLCVQSAVGGDFIAPYWLRQPQGQLKPRSLSEENTSFLVFEELLMERKMDVGLIGSDSRSAARFSAPCWRGCRGCWCCRCGWWLWARVSPCSLSNAITTQNLTAVVSGSDRWAQHADWMCTHEEAKTCALDCALDRHWLWSYSRCFDIVAWVLPFNRRGITDPTLKDGCELNEVTPKHAEASVNTAGSGFAVRHPGSHRQVPTPVSCSMLQCIANS